MLIENTLYQPHVLPTGSELSDKINFIRSKAA